ncbi:hypothetical protein K3495_g6042 [Podosphaera aphanis]|nr:hypothetical protein K3495_g6042 [Podosphaera aphanis]
METIKKARVVARGFEQQAGIDYFETFASVVRYNTLRIILAISAVEDLEVDCIDFITAFLNPPLKEETYLEIPPIFELLDPSANRNTHYLKLNKSLYGLKQAPHEWFMMVKDFFVKLGLKAGNSDPNLFIGLGVYILLFVDDMLIVGKRLSVDKIKASILRNWNGKDLKTAKLFVGFEIERDRLRRSIIIRQTIYFKKLLEIMGRAKCNSNDLPIPAGAVLKESEESDLLKEDEKGLPDIAYAVGQLARFMSKPGTIHLKMAKHLLRYLQGTQDLGIQYRGQDQQTTQYSARTDATWGTETDRKSFQGYVIIRHGGAVSWAANRQKSTALSTMEAEIMAASEGAGELAWMEKVCSDLGLKFDSPPTLRIDNEPAIDLSKATNFHTKAKHIEIRHFFIRNDMVQRNRIEVVHTPGTDQIADVLTKQLPKDQFRKLLRGFGLK